MALIIEGILQSLGSTLTGGVGAEIRGSSGKLIVIPGLSNEQLRELGPHLFKQVRVRIEVIEESRSTPD